MREMNKLIYLFFCICIHQFVVIYSERLLCLRALAGLYLVLFVSQNINHGLLSFCHYLCRTLCGMWLISHRGESSVLAEWE